jgi:hypothetical protein
MAERHVVFLALGGTRRAAAVDEARRVVAGDGDATIVVAEATAWRNDRLAAGVRMIELQQLELRHGWMPFEQLVLVRFPRLVFRIVGLGPIKRWSERASGAYRRRIADPLHQRAFLPLLRRRPGALAATLIRRHLGSARSVDLIVVNDPASMPAAVALLETYDRGGSPRVAYSIDNAASAVPTPPAQLNGGQPQGDR